MDGKERRGEKKEKVSEGNFLMGKKQNRSLLNSPEFVICVSHLVRSKFRHKDFDDVDEDKEVDLKKTETCGVHINPVIA